MCDDALNAHVGCEHGCRYCYARFMKRFSGHAAPWGSFVDVKVNAPELLARIDGLLRREHGGMPNAWASRAASCPLTPASAETGASRGTNKKAPVSLTRPRPKIPHAIADLCPA